MTRFTALIALSVFLVQHTVRGAVVAQDIHIVNANLSPDGFTRSTVVAEGTFPGPLITGNTGDNLQLNVIDELTDTTMLRGTSIHWHGFFQKGTNEMDGPVSVNQCPIIPGNSFLYNFDTPGQAGTFWYHSHYSTQYCDGLRGPIVIYDPNDPQADLYDVDDETTVITLADWYHSVSTVLFPGTNKAAPNPSSTLINGLGRFSGGSATDLAVVSVTQNTRYRFRLVSLSCFPSFTFQIDGHSLTIIEADGQNTVPHTVNTLSIFAGQRYSIVVTADQPIGNYWIRANPSSGTTGFTGGINSAILRYDGAAVADPTSTQTTGTVLSEADLSALEDPAAPGQPFSGGVDRAIQMTVGRDAATGDLEVNGVPFLPPSVPVLLQILSGNTAPGSIMPSGSIYSLPGNSVIEINFPGGGNHPFHLHGHAFSVVRSAGSTTYNYVNPVRRDVVSIGAGGDNVTFRFTTDNAGPWFLHCHIDWHLEAGLAIVFAEDADNVAAQNPVNQDWENLCPDYNAANPDTAFGE